MKAIQFHFFIQQFIKRASILKRRVQCVWLILSIATANAQEVKMYTGCNMVLNGNIYVVVNNTAFKNNGIFTAGTSTVQFTGDTDTSIAYISGSSNTIFNNLTLNKSVYGIALKSSVGVMNVLTLSAGKLYADSNLTLLSDVNNTARLATVPAGAYAYGKVMVERYIPSRRAWRLMTAPVTNTPSIYNTWQNAGVYTVGKGLLVSGPVATNGLDIAHPTSMYTWNLSSQSYLPVTNTYSSISATNNGSADNTGYFLFIRGDRNPANFIIPNTNITTLTSIGSLQTGSQVFNAATTAGGFTLIGNPYASPIDFNSVTRSNLLKRFYVWDPTINALGGYVTMDDLDNDGIYSKSVYGSAQTKEIQSSQAFFVETSGNGAASLTIDENAKSGTNNSYVFRPFGGAQINGTIESLRVNLYLLNIDSTTVLADGALAEFGDGFTDKVTSEDAIKFTNINENIGFTRYASTLSIERRPLIDVTDTLFLKLWKTTLRNYQLQLVPESMDQPGLTGYLEDSYLVTSSPINLADTVTINFTVDANAASAVVNRFRIVFKQAKQLPVAFTWVKAFQVSNNIQVDWQAQNEANTIKYEVEKSANGLDFTFVNTTATNATGTYSWIDEAPFDGENFFRIKSIDRNGAIKYSPIVKVMMERKIISFTILPNPVKGSNINLHFANQPRGNYQFNLINSMGQLVSSTKLLINSGSTTQVLKTNTGLSAGVYQLQITGPANTIETLTLIKQQ